jgi:hypothetical protein
MDTVAVSRLGFAVGTAAVERAITPSHFRLLLAFLRDWDVTGRPDRSYL